MRSMRTLSLIILGLAACGDDGGNNNATPDASIGPDAPPDAPPLPPGCDYAELHDTTNDDFTVQTGMAETTNLTFSAATTLCGKVDTGHFADMAVDVDSFAVTLAAPAQVYVTLTGTGLEGLAQVDLFMYTGMDFATFVGAGTFTGNHSVLTQTLPAGSYEFSILAGNAAATTAPIDYKIKIATDTPDTRCAAVTATANYTEALDNVGNLHTGNDIIAIDLSMNPSQTLTAATTDVLEPTAITVAPATNYRITGSSADIAVAASYRDKDTFQFTTGAATNELTIRLTWPGTTSDLDYHLFEGTTIPSVGSSLRASNTGPEYATFAVKPSTSYSLWIGNWKDSPMTAVAYDASLCGATFTP